MLSFLDPSSAESRSQLVFLQSAWHQYWRKGLDLAVSFPAVEEKSENLKYDWNLGQIRVVSGPGIAVEKWPSTALISPEGGIAGWWKGFVTPAELGLKLRNRIGPPTSSPAVLLPLER